MMCCTSRGDDESEAHLLSFPFDWFASGNSKSSSSVKDKNPLDESSLEAQSEEIVRRHSAALPGERHLLVYHIPPAPRNHLGKRRPQAEHVPCNLLQGVPIESEHFKGHLLLMYRPTEGLEKSHPFYHYFTSRKRNWEMRLQGKFKTVPKGGLCVGAVLRDFDYDQPVASSSILAMNTAMSLIKYQYKIYFSWGARCKAALEPDAELGSAVSDLSVFDHIVVTPAGRPAPLVHTDMDELSDVYGLSLMRRDLGIAEYSKMISEVMHGINTEDTYTFRLWGLSQMLDVLNWQLKIGARVSLAHFMKEFPIHICMYDLDGGTPETPHLESRKRYFFDFMGWSNMVKCPSLPDRYVFEDAADGLEHAAYAPHMRRLQTGNSFHSIGSGSAADQSQSLWARWKDRVKEKLRWIPTSTCSMPAERPYSSH